jgi:peptide/nickel transport system permease protein
MMTYIARRLVLAVATMWAISILAFVIIQLPPGDFVDAYIANLSASGSVVSMEEAQNLRKLYGLDQPIYIQYGKWMARILVGDFGV